ncbi:MAG: phosphatidylserine decarboxylase [Alphaproteobacteria bacterium]|nr:phosphatidylserine decarboxylase [Alphaproteobacteria bacterium]
MRPRHIAPIHREGWPFVALFAVVAAGLALLWQPLGWLGLLLTAWCAYFFRDPARVVPDRAGLVVSPADGVVQLVEPGVPPPELGLGELPRPRVSIFMDVFDVHVNRMPIAATVRHVAYRPGKFLNASLDKASVENERMGLALTTDDGRDLAVVQIAGLVARRIKCWTRAGERLATGERFGMIRFGSRVDVYLPDGAAPLVVEGQRSVGGETVIADLAADEPPRRGVLR